MLNLKDVHASYGQIPALHGVSLEVPKSQIVTILGANGSGKSTTIRTIAGLLSGSDGSVEFDGQEILGLSADRIVQMGISVVPEGRQLFGEMTVLENLRLGAYSRGSPTVARLTAAYTTGYLAQLVPIPFVATGGVDAATTFTLAMVGVRVEVALLAVVTHRVFAFWLPIGPGLWSAFSIVSGSRHGDPPPPP